MATAQTSLPRVAPSGFQAHIQRSGRHAVDKPSALSLADLEDSSDSPMSSSPSEPSIPSISPMPSYPSYGGGTGGGPGEYYSYSPLSSPISPYSTSPGSCYFSYTNKSSSTGPIRVSMARPRSLSSPVTGSFPLRRNSNLASSPLGRASDRLGMVAEGEGEEPEPPTTPHRHHHGRHSGVDTAHRGHASSEPLPVGNASRVPIPRLSVSIPGTGTVHRSTGSGALATSPLGSPLSSTMSTSSSSSSGRSSCASPSKLHAGSGVAVGSFPIRKDSRPSPLHAVIGLPETFNDGEDEDEEDEAFVPKGLVGAAGLPMDRSEEESLGFGSMDFGEEEEGERTVRSATPDMIVDGRKGARTPTQKTRSGGKGHGLTAMVCD